MKERLKPLYIIFRAFNLIFSYAKIDIILLNVLNILIGLIAIFMLKIMNQFYDNLNNFVSYRVLTPVLTSFSIFIFIQIADMFIMHIQHILFEKFVDKVEARNRFILNKKLADCDPILYEDPDFLDSVDKASEGALFVEDLISTILYFITGFVPYIVFVFIYLYSLDPILALAIIIIFIPSIINKLIQSRHYDKLIDEKTPLKRKISYYEQCIIEKNILKKHVFLAQSNSFVINCFL